MQHSCVHKIPTRDPSKNGSRPLRSETTAQDRLKRAPVDLKYRTFQGKGG